MYFRKKSAKAYVACVQPPALLKKKSERGLSDFFLRAGGCTQAKAYATIPKKSLISKAPEGISKNKGTWSENYWEKGNKRKIKLLTLEQKMCFCNPDICGIREHQRCTSWL